MEKMKVSICVKNDKYAADLARGLAERSEQLNISVVSGSESKAMSELSDCDVVISDEIEKKDYDPRYLLLEGMEASVCTDMYRSEGQVIDYRSPTSAIIKYVNEIAVRANAGSVSMRDATENNIQICVLLSTMGGSGVSAAALTMGRILASEEEQRVLYIHIGKSKGYSCYVREAQRAIRPSAELVCMLRNGADASADSYLSKDSYGLHLIDIEDGEVYILKYIIENRLFDTVIIDTSSDLKPIPTTRLFVFHNEKDIRSKLSLSQKHKKSKEMAKEISKDKSKEKSSYTDKTDSWRRESENSFDVYNRSHYNYTEGQEIHIADDPVSFTVTVDGVEIAHDRDYADGIRRMVRAVEFNSERFDMQ